MDRADGKLIIEGLTGDVEFGVVAGFHFKVKEELARVGVRVRDA